MREIKFRGKRVENGEWVTGYGLFSKDNSEAVIAKLTDTKTACEYVAPDTVGQFTGLHDCDGNPDGVPRESWEVLGNIHDNPELLYNQPNTDTRLSASYGQRLTI